MKNNIIIAAAFILLGLQTQAQTEKGSKNLGINFEVSTVKNTNSIVDLYNQPGTQTIKNTNFYVGPNFSYFVSNGVDIGLNVGYSHSTYDNSYFANSQKQTNQSASATLYARKYILHQNKIGIRTGPYASYLFGNHKTTYSASSASNSDQKVNEYAFGANADLLFYPLKNLGLTASIFNASYHHAKQDDGKLNRQEQDSFNINFLNTLAFSVFYVFGGK